MLSTKFNLKSNVPLQRILTPAERAAIRWMSGQHLTMPGVTWLDTVVDEPDFDLRIKKKLYVAAPIMTEELERALGVHRTSASRHGLLVAFYEAPLDEARRHPFRIAGIEMVRTRTRREEWFVNGVARTRWRVLRGGSEGVLAMSSRGAHLVLVFELLKGRRTIKLHLEH